MNLVIVPVFIASPVFRPGGGTATCIPIIRPAVPSTGTTIRTAYAFLTSLFRPVDIIPGRNNHYTKNENYYQVCHTTLLLSMNIPLQASYPIVHKGIQSQLQL